MLGLIDETRLDGAVASGYSVLVCRQGAIVDGAHVSQTNILVSQLGKIKVNDSVKVAGEGASYLVVGITQVEGDGAILTLSAAASFSDLDRLIPVTRLPVLFNARVSGQEIANPIVATGATFMAFVEDDDASFDGGIYDVVATLAANPTRLGLDLEPALDLPDTRPVVASAASIKLPDHAPVVEISGQEDITHIEPKSLDQLPQSQLVTLVFTGTASTNGVVNGGNLDLNTAASDLTYDIGDTLTLTCDGSTWQEVARSVNS